MVIPTCQTLVWEPRGKRSRGLLVAAVTELQNFWGLVAWSTSGVDVGVGVGGLVGSELKGLAEIANSWGRIFGKAGGRHVEESDAGL